MKRRKVIAVDFDGTLCTHRFPEIGSIGKIHNNVHNYIKAEKENGSIIILWTCREDSSERKYLTEAVEWCKQHDIPIDYVNEYPMPGSPCPKFATRKVYADIYIDDKAMNISQFKSEGE